MRRTFACCAVGAFLSVAGCASTTLDDGRQVVGPVELFHESEIRVQYRGEVATGGALRDTAARATDAENTNVDESCILSVQLGFLELSEKAAGSIFGLAEAVQAASAYRLGQEDAGRLMQSYDAKELRVLSAPSMAIYEGQSGEVLVFNQEAYVGGYEVAEAGAKDDPETHGCRYEVIEEHDPAPNYTSSFIPMRRCPAAPVEPVVHVLETGILMRVSARRTPEGRLHLWLSASSSELAAPVCQTEVEVLGEKIALQIPVVFQQVLHADGEIDGGATLLLTGLKSLDGSPVLLLVRIERIPVPPEENAGEGD